MIFLLIVILFSFLYVRLTYRLNYWKRKNVSYVGCDIYATAASLIHNAVPSFDHYARIYAELSGHKYGGCYQLFRPQFVVRDPELVKHVLSKHFEYFRDRGNVNYDEHDPITNHLFSAPGNLWKPLRTRLTPTFTSGKMKYMFETVKECAEEWQRTLEKPAAHNIALNFKDISVGYTIEVIGSTAFGWKTNSINDAHSDFNKITRLLFRRQLRHVLRTVVHSWFPFLRRYFTIHLLSRNIRDFFANTVRQAIEYRRATGYKRNDFLQLLMTLNEQTSTQPQTTTTLMAVNQGQYELKLTNDLMTAQCFLFFVAGFDTSSLILSMTLLEMAANQNIQKKLQEEIDTAMDENENKITYEMIKSMRYLQKVVNETLRKYPVLSNISRICTKTYQVPGTDVIIEKGVEVIIPLSGLHRDESIYPNPEVYDPERFNEDEIQKRHHYAYIPFGEGPRNCIGLRFGLMTVKLGIIHILKKFNLEMTSETVYPMKFKPNKTVTDCNHPLLLKCSNR